MAGQAQQRRAPAKAGSQLDPQEERALSRAGEAVARFGQAHDPRSVAAVAISAWIISRTSSAASTRLNADLLFDLGDARLRGFVEAALGQVALSLTGQGFDFNLPFGALEKAQVVDLFVAGIQGAREAAVAANESLGFPFDDEIPY